MANWQKETADKAEGSLRSNPFEGFEAYTTAPVETVSDSPATEQAEADRGPRNFKGSVPSDSYKTV